MPTMPPRQFFLPMLYRPALVIVVDDDVAFTDRLEAQMDPAICVRCFRNPHEASQWLNDLYSSIAPGALPLTREAAGAFDSEATGGPSFDIRSVSRSVCDRQRFLYSTVVVVDFAMPEWTGPEFCKSIAALPCKKILFSSIALRAEATAGKRDDSIDMYVTKEDKWAFNKLEVEIFKLNRKFFLEQTRVLDRLLDDPAYSFMTDREFSLIVQDVCVYDGYIEHYLLACSPGLLLIGREGETKVMIIETEAGLMAHAKTVEEHGGDPELVSLLRTQSVVPFFWQGNGQSAAQYADWKECTNPATVHKFDDTYYWALFDMPAGFLKDPIYSYSQHQSDYAKAKAERKKLRSLPS